MTDVQRKRLTFRSWHRGCKESDLVFGPFADAWLAHLDDAQLADYERLLEEDDADLWDWLSAKRPLPERLDTPLFAILKRFAFERAVPEAQPS